MSLIKITISAVGVLIVMIVFMVTFDSFGFTNLQALVITSQNYKQFASCIGDFSDQKPSSFKIIQAAINSDGKKDAIVQYTKGPQCGSGGCVYELCVSDSNTGSYRHIPFGLTGKSIEVLQTITNNMHDLELNHDVHLVMSWNGSAYELTTNY